MRLSFYLCRFLFTRKRVHLSAFCERVTISILAFTQHNDVDIDNDNEFTLNL